MECVRSSIAKTLIGLLDYPGRPMRDNWNPRGKPGHPPEIAIN